MGRGTARWDLRGGRLHWEQGVCAEWMMAVLEVGTLAMMEGIRMTPMGWVSPWDATGSTGAVSGPFSSSWLSAEPQMHSSPSKWKPWEPADAGWEPSECHKHSVTRLGSIHQCAAVVK